MALPDTDARWYPWRPEPWRASWFACCAALAVATPIVAALLTVLTMMLGSFGRALVGLAGSAGGLAAMLRFLEYASAPLRGYRVDDAGLTLVPGTGEPQTVAWDEIEAVRVVGETATIAVPHGTWTIGPTIRNARTLIRDVTDGVDATRVATAQGASVPPDQVAEWLGIEADEVVVCQPRFRPLTFLGWPLALVALLLAWVLPEFQVGEGLLILLSIALAGWAPFYLGITGSLLREASRREVHAGVWGLRFRTGRQWTSVDWVDLLSLRRVPRENRQSLYYPSEVAMKADTEWLVTAEGAEFRFHPTADNAGRLEHAIRQAIEARRNGQLLPRMAEVPDTAVSRAEVVSPADRALSATEEE